MTSAATTSPRIRTADMFTVTIGQLVVCPLNARRMMDSDAIERLGKDICARGLINPLLVRTLARTGDAQYEIICGTRRHAAIVGAIRRGELTSDFSIAVSRAEIQGDLEVLTMVAAENLHRADLTPIEEAELYAAMREHVPGPGRPETRIAELLNVGERTIWRRLSLLRAIEPVRQALCVGRIGLRQAEAFAQGGIPDQKHYFERMLAGRLSDQVTAISAAMSGLSVVRLRSSHIDRPKDFIAINGRPLLDCSGAEAMLAFEVLRRLVPGVPDHAELRRFYTASDVANARAEASAAQIVAKKA